MKIEMGESLSASWLKHVCDCTLVQTNWKPSPRWTENHLLEIDSLVQSAKQFFGTLNVFKKNADAEQILHQTECDVVGLSHSGGSARWHVVEVAFHENGVQYGNKYETAAKIAGKLFRAAIGLYCYMNVKDGEICFLTPKSNPSYSAEIYPAVECVAAFFKENGFGFDFRFIANEDFKQMILDPIVDVEAEVADTTELFLRALQLKSIFCDGEDALEGNAEVACASVDKKGDSAAVKEKDGEIKIGRLVQTVMRDILENFDDKSEVLDLMDPIYSREAFGVSFPILVPADGLVDNNRYYTKPVKICGCDYRLCNEWKPRNRARLESWIKAHETLEE